MFKLVSIAMLGMFGSILNLAEGSIPLLSEGLLLLLPLGLLLLISSALPEKQAPAAAISLLMGWAVAALAYFGVGFAFHFGGIAQVSPRPDLSGLYWEWYPLDQSVDVEVARLWGLIALRGWVLSGEAATSGAFRLFLSHLALVGAAAMIPMGVLLERDRSGAALLAALLTGAVIYPLPGNWVWGGGWLAHLGLSLELGHGLVDFGGAGVIWLSGGMAALAAVWLFRAAPRPAAGEDTEAEGPLEVVPMPTAYLPILSMLGGGLVFVGWLGLSAGLHMPTAVDFDPAYTAVGGLLAALSGALAAAGYSWFATRRLDALMCGRGLAAGLGVAMAGTSFMPLWITILAGLGIGLALAPLIYLFEHKLGLADRLGVITTYGVSGLISLLLVGFFASGWAGQGWNNSGSGGVAGLIANDPGQLQAQLVGAGTIMIWSFGAASLLFVAIKRLSPLVEGIAASDHSGSG